MAKATKLHRTFGKVLRELRLEAGLSQEKLGLECDLHRNYVSLLERGLRQPSLTTIFKLTEQLDVSPSQMMSLVEKRQARK